MPPLARFVTGDGQFRTVAFAGFMAVRPWLWLRVLRLARNSNTAAAALCEWLEQYNQEPEDVADPEPGLHPSSGGQTQS